MAKKKYIIKVWHKETPKHVMYVSKFKNGEADLSYDRDDAKIYSYEKCADKCRKSLVESYNDGLFGETVYTELVNIEPKEFALYNRDYADLSLFSLDGEHWAFHVDDEHEYVLEYMRGAFEEDGTIEMVDPSGGPYITKGYEFGDPNVTYVVDSIERTEGKGFAIIAHRKP